MDAGPTYVEVMDLDTLRQTLDMLKEFKVARFEGNGIKVRFSEPEPTPETVVDGFKTTSTTLPMDAEVSMHEKLFNGRVPKFKKATNP